MFRIESLPNAAAMLLTFTVRGLGSDGNLETPNWRGWDLTKGLASLERHPVV